MPNFVSAYVNRSIAYTHQGDYDHALKDLNEAIRLAPDYSSAYLNRGIVYEHQGNLEQAIADYRQASELPDTGEGAPDKARQQLQRLNAE